MPRRRAHPFCVRDILRRFEVPGRPHGGNAPSAAPCSPSALRRLRPPWRVAALNSSGRSGVPAKTIGTFLSLASGQQGSDCIHISSIPSVRPARSTRSRIVLARGSGYHRLHTPAQLNKCRGPMVAHGAGYPSSTDGWPPPQSLLWAAGHAKANCVFHADYT
jgi:hypothetical protein